MDKDDEGIKRDSQQRFRSAILKAVTINITYM